MGRVRLVGALASLAGVAVYNTWLKNVPLRRMFLWTAVLGTVLGLTQLVLITGASALPFCSFDLWCMRGLKSRLRRPLFLVLFLETFICDADTIICHLCAAICCSVWLVYLQQSSSVGLINML